MEKIEYINEFIVKVSSRCNLNCTYCYEYNLGDDSWKKMEKKISILTVKQIAKQIINHCQKYEINDIVISLHGGEPLLIGNDHLEKVIKELKVIENANIQLLLTLQTNATLISGEVIDLLLKYKVYVSASLDGNEVHNKNRIFHNKQNSFDQALDGILKLKNQLKDQFIGVLSVIDIKNSPVETYSFFKEREFTNVDFILPDYSWNNLPPRPFELSWINNIDKSTNSIIYGLWYSQMLDLWLKDKNSIRIRFFENIIHNLVTGNGLFELMSRQPVTLITINTNGDFEGVDTLKSLANGYQKLNLNVFDNGLDDVMSHPKYLLRQHPTEQYGSKCLNCNNLAACWGGYFPHRLQDEKIRESIYCNDLYFIIDEIKNYLKK